MPPACGLASGRHAGQQGEQGEGEAAGDEESTGRRRRARGRRFDHDAAGRALFSAPPSP